MEQENPLDISVVIPVFGGEATLRTLVGRCVSALDIAGARHEILLICDRPRDGSWPIAQELARELDSVQAVLLRRNFGQHPATLLGIRRARGRIVVTMDEDLQHDPDDIPTLVATAEEIGGIAYGIAEELRHSWWRNLSSRVAKRIVARYLGLGFANDISAFRAFPAELREAFADYRGERVAVDVLLSWAGAPIRSVRCEYSERAQGQSGYSVGKLVGYLLDLALGYSTAPLRLASWLGICSVVVAIAIAAYVLQNWVRHGSAVPGFAFIGLSVATFAGVQLLALGLIGEYLGRLYFNSLAKPQYLVAEVERGNAPAEESTSTEATGG